MKKYLLIFFLLTCVISKAQNLINSSNYPFSTYINTPIEDMAASNLVIGAGKVSFSSSPIAFGNGFNFFLNGVQYDSLVLNARGFIRLGSNTGVYSLTPPEIAPMSAYMTTGSNGFVKTKMVGTFPNRKFVVHWKVNLQSGTITSAANHNFQLWLHENGRIDFVYGSTSTSWPTGTFTGYKTYITPLIPSQHIQVDIASIFTNSTVNYGSNYFNEITPIPTNSKISFVPDSTLVNKPICNFGTVSSACIELLITDTTRNENGFRIFRSTDGIIYDHLVSSIQSNTLDSGMVYSVNDQLLSQETHYYYQVIAYNLGTEPDTVYLDTITINPSLSGIKSIPGDYLSISEALEDIRCKQIASNLILELTDLYNSNNEHFPLFLDDRIWTDTNKTLTIRPSLGTNNILIQNNDDVPMFIISEGNYFKIDGRSGGIGQTNLIIRQNISVESIFTLKNNSKFNTINNCNLYSKGKYDGLKQTVIYFDSLNNSNNIVEDCKFIPLSNSWLEYIILSNGSNSNRNSFNTIRNCEFVNYGSQYKNLSTSCFGSLVSAVHLEKGNSDWTITGNHFYYTDTLQNTKTNSIYINSPEGSGYLISNNHFGGSTTFCNGNVSSIIDQGGNTFNFIRFIADSTNINEISGNRILAINLKISGNGEWDKYDFFSIKCNKVIVNNNIFGDSLNENSITYTNQYAVIPNIDAIQMNLLYNDYSTWDIKYNSFYGIKLSKYIGALITILPYNYLKSITRVENNQIGSFLNTGIKTDYGFTAINAGSITINDVSISNNIIQNIRLSGSGSLRGIFVDQNYVGSINNPNEQLKMTGNIIHDLSSEIKSFDVTIFGIFVGITSVKATIENNHVHSLYGYRSASATQNYSIKCSVSGIYSGLKYYSSYPVIYKYSNIRNNFVHHLSSESGGDVNGISCSGGRFIVENNMISLGRDKFGQTLKDSLYSTNIGGISVVFNYDNPELDTVYINHNSIYVTGDSTIYSKFKRGSCISIDGSHTTNIKKFVSITNNIIASTRKGAIVDYFVSFLPDEDTVVDVCDYNQYYATYDQFNSLNLFYGFSEWKNLYHKDQHSFFNPPLFINPEGDPSSCNLHLQAANYSEGMGAISSLEVDFDQDDRSSLGPVDIGADAGNFYLIPTCHLINDTLICNKDSLLLDAGNYYSYLWNTGDTSQTIVVANSGFYFVTITDSLGFSSSDTVHVLIDSLIPSFDLLGNEYVLCLDSSFNMVADSGFFSYLWSNGDTSQTTIINEIGEYTLKITNSNHCSYYDTIQVKTDSIYAIFYETEYSICNSDSIPYLFTPLTYNYQLDGITVQDSVYLYSDQDYSLLITSNHGCSVQKTINVNEYENYSIENELNICYGDSLFLVDDFQNQSGYFIDSLQTINGCDSIISNHLIVNQLPNVSLNPFDVDTVCTNSNGILLPDGIPSNGSYSGSCLLSNLFYPQNCDTGNVVITYTYIDSNQCLNTDSISIYVSACLSIDELFPLDNTVIVYPNPFQEQVTILLSAEMQGNVDIKIYNVLGECVYNKSNLYGNQIIIKQSEIGKGIFIIELSDKQKEYTKIMEVISN